MRNKLFILILFVVTLSVSAQNGSEAYTFLRFPTSTRANALGGHTVALVERDPSLIFHNPALLGAEMDGMINLNYMNYISDINVGSALFTKAHGEKGAWGVGATFISYGDIKEVLPDNVVTGASLSAKDISVGGYSAGGALTAAMGICCAERGGFVPKLQILCYPPLEYRIPDQYKIDAYDRQIGMERCKAFADLYFDDKKENFEDIHNSPLYAPREILAKQPKTLILSAGLCNFRYEDEDYAICLADAGAEVILKRFPEASHGFIPHFMDGWKEAADLMVREILEK